MKEHDERESLDDRRESVRAPEHERGEDAPELVVGLGASAGGLRPLADFLAELDEDLGAAFIIVQHLDPDRASTAPELLQTRTSLPVRKAEDGEPLRPDHVYVNPPDTRIAVRDGALELRSPLEDRGHPTVVDLLFRSLAEDQRHRSVAVVFSGTGSDGTLGVTRVRAAGGLTMAQDPETAEFRDMPENAIATGDVDVVLSPPELASHLTSYVQRRSVHGSEQRQLETGQLLAEISRILEEKTDIDFSLYKESTLLRRIERRYLMSDVRDLTEYVELLEDDPQEVAQLHADLLIGVTSFFRNPEAFEALEEAVLRKLVDGASGEEELRIWVPACGTGQEAYSIAMLVSECLADAGRESPVKIFATDIDEEALSAARQGRYPRGIEDEVPGDLLRRYFDEEATGYRVSSPLRDLILFSKQNVLSDPPFSDLDLISCRNLAIYLQTEAQEDLFRIFHFALRENGVLFLGESENVGRRSDLFRTVDQKARIFRRRSVETRMPLPMPLSAPSSSAVSTSSRFGLSRVPTGGAKRGRFESRLRRKLLDHLAPTSVVINGNQEVIYFHGETGRYLEQPAGAPSHDIVEMARPELRRELRTAIHHVMQTGEAASREQVSVRADGDPGSISLQVRPMSLDDEEELYLVVFRDSMSADATSDEPREIDLDEVSPDVLEEMERELRDTRERLQSTIEELESSNEELRSMNEELQTANEELQTSREEARAANEELQSVNEELNAKIKELNRTHSDLENLLQSTQIATVFVDRQMRVRRFTPAATSIFRLQDRDRGRPLADITNRLDLPDDLDLVDEMEEVLETLLPTEREVRRPGRDEWYTMRIMPYRTVDDRIEGIVLTFTDVTRLKKLQRARSKLIAVMEGMPDAIVGRDLEGMITSWNRGAERIFGYTEQEALGRNIRTLVPEDRRNELERYHRQAAEGNWTEPVETVRVRKDGGRVDVSLNFSCVRDDRGNIVEIAGIARDITERIEATREVERANQRQTEFMAMLSHELRNPLAPMRHAIDLLRGTDEEDPEVRDRAREILDRQIGYLSRLVDDLTDVARIASGTPSLDVAPLDLVEVIRNVVRDYEPLAGEFDKELVADLPEGPVPLTADSARLSQVVGNLLDNAFTHTPAGGHVDVYLRTEEGDAVVTVEDEGPGLSDVQLEEVFEPFHQAREPGTRAGDGLGLGLTVARRLIEMHGGTLTAESEGADAGTIFRMRLPLEPEDRKRPARSGAEESGRVAEEDGEEHDGEEHDGECARRVLIVEDYEDAAETMAMTLRSVGCDVEVAADAAEGLRMAGEHRPEVVLCDIGLPGDRDGYDLARSIRSDRELGDIRIVAVTGFGSDLDRETANEAGFDDLLTKPINAEELLAAVRR